ncbi:MAG: hypothetical protein P9L94_06060 [Candidatus Hinthialibacter antarcticus]|nr:hypothetical protein [Candidatus Hinthialibacter antarcticus]
MLKKFSPEAIEQMKYYVYLYINPDTKEIFYVGKGKGNRAFSHLEDKKESEKAQYIEEIRNRNAEPEIEILVHGFDDEETALRIEAAIIDLLEPVNLTNQVRGHKSITHGRISAELLNAKYLQEDVVIDDPVILIRINQMFYHGMPHNELYDATRQYWVVGERREKAKYALAVYHGIVREVYAIHSWHPGGTFFSCRDEGKPWELYDERYEFIGNIAPKKIRNKYQYKSVSKYFSNHSQNPITYVNID